MQRISNQSGQYELLSTMSFSTNISVPLCTKNYMERMKRLFIYKMSNPLLKCFYLASSSSWIGSPFLLQRMSSGESPVDSQIRLAFSPFLTDNRTLFSSNFGGAEKRKIMEIHFLQYLYT